MQPKDLTINVGTGGTATGQATFDLNATATLVATPSMDMSLPDGQDFIW